jgi:hypothetical protein
LNPPKGVGGRTYRVDIWVSAEGRVERVITVTPDITDDAYRRDFLKRVLDYRFFPAKTRDGRPVAGRVTVSIFVP